ncbi:osteocrin-like [Acipenser ruthenus]|uniref:osteocrin-like n=1 Tax=Acipenser ruthenus TaxID=7906 RepID=UPI0027427615|nr:osteocrin-like [Acipenser ruthenus]
MLGCRWVLVHCLLAVTLLHWISGRSQLAEGAPEFLDSSMVQDVGSSSVSGEEKVASDLTAKLLLLNKLVSLENDVMETKRKRSFPGFGTPLDRLSLSTMEMKGKQRKEVDLPKRRFGVPIDRLGMNRMANSRG